MTSDDQTPTVSSIGDMADEMIRTALRRRRHAKNPDAVWVEGATGRCAVADISDFRQFQLVGPSAEVWNRIDGFASDDEVVRAVLACYPGHPATAYAECGAFIETMTDLGLLVHQPGSDRGEPDDMDPRPREGLVAQPAQEGTVT